MFIKKEALNKKNKIFFSIQYCSIVERHKPKRLPHRLYMKLDLQSLFGLLLHVHSCNHWLRPRNPPPPPSTAFGLKCEGAIGQSR